MNVSEHGAIAFLYGLEGRDLGQVIIDEWFGVDLGEEVTLELREGGLFGLQQYDNPIVAGSSVVPRSRATKPWLRAKKGRARQ
ncbi:hypothetical protein [Pseudomonas juntendi]|uniref:Uncharacterized protein n=1 Tax=Pseudomonas juntendi TaxID=2666183 RepID=A0A7W2PRI8_9PSED|nr:hypothetical protein [Pseudomonas juntendi]MBA6058102.1 hypothetical protein [Pseudomonas juntendi]MBA6126598.1 hypothetical protein [Pseudomonas juntendi]